MTKESINPFVHGIDCEKCGNHSFHVINDGGCVLVISCTKCGTKRDFLLDTTEEE